MKKLLYLALITLVIASCTSQPAKDTSYSINVNLKGVEDGTIYLTQRKNGEWLKLDSADVSAAINFNGNIDFPEMYYLSIKDKRGNIPVFVDAAKIIVDGHIDSVRQVKITGSPAQDELAEFSEQTKVFDDQLQKIYKDYRVAYEEKNEELKNQLEKKMETLNEGKIDFTFEYVLEHNASVVSAFLALQNNYYFELDQLDSITSGFDPSIDQSTYVQELKARVEVLQSVAIGKPYIDFTMNNTEGVAVEFSSLLSDKYILVDFWASWCGPCRRENPNVVAVFNDYKNKGFDVIGISLDKDKDKWLEAIESDKLTWSHVSDLKYWSNSAAKLYGVNSIPHSILLDKDGVIIAKNLRAEELRAKITELLD
jgi:thiol-disulfide isomerase/thioredoxin